MRFINRKTLALAGAAATLVAVGSTGTAVAGHLVGSADIQDGSIRSIDIKDGHVRTTDLSADAIAKLHGKDGKDGKDGLAGAFYATAYYNAGDTNAGAIATVACDPTSTAFTAIAGGVQVTGLDAGANARNTPVSSSFPGRMDWNTNTPRADRLDGWIVQFGGNAGAASDKAPEKVKVWALCVPNTNIPVHQTFSQVG
jgi:hypothetical protein